jgi:ABC-type transporter Mla subunit MlaD
MNAHHARFREEQQRFSAQLENSLEMLNEARDQRSKLLELTAVRTQEVDELSDQLRQLTSALQRKEADIKSLEQDRERAAAETAAEIESIRRAFNEESAEMQRVYLQKQVEDKRVFDASWSALAVIRKEIEESAQASCQIQLGASMSKLRSSLESEIRHAFETQISELQARVCDADVEVQRVADERDATQQKLQVTVKELQESAALQEQMRTVEESFSLLRSNLEASAQTEAQLRDVIRQQEGQLQRQQEKLDAAAATALMMKNLESVVVHLNELLHSKESECEGLKSCKAQLEEETKMRVAAQEDLAALAGSQEVSHEDFLEAAKGMISTERQRFEQQHASDQARLLELQLELKKCKAQIQMRVVENKTVPDSGRTAA